jgi:hypothetical protein
MAEPIRVILADDHPVVRSGICAALRADQEMKPKGFVNSITPTCYFWICICQEPVSAKPLAGCVNTARIPK